ncbi:hypothetical protein NM208_g5784 [Fusarium decemcellulare]|uniref:Uncharacterized protein n=1 Tax=Fusarium decemcellulare TaxID=57161 RepID=A0ACC1SFW1_9HYPO|nr:hypothetical protein NM208_g5784 [Fusarium decemcellulare]
MSLSLVEACHPATFNPIVFGTEILSIETDVVSNYSASVPEAFRYTAPAVELQNASFCNVTISYTHPGQDDEVFVEAWLPLQDWNGRFLAVGGGGSVAGRFFLSYNAMQGALADGFATITTDAGLGSATDASSWALLSPGNAVLGKSLIQSFYGRGPDFSYWNGCSQGGRQGLMLAQRFPTAYDGIAAGAPAIHWTEFLPSIQWPQQVMNELADYPYGCEIDAITEAAVSACDGLDGTVDGVIAHVDECLNTFDPFSVVGKTIKCDQLNETTIEVSQTAAIVVNATWHGMTTADGKHVWYGIAPGADLTGNSPTSYGQPGVVSTNCTASGCVGAANDLGLQWLKLFVARDPNKNLSNLTRSEFDDLVHASRQQYSSIIGTTDPDLSRFRDAGGKMITFHGLADNIIPPKGTEQYYNQVSAVLPHVHDFYRYFEAPGLGHCFGGLSSPPSKLFAQLRAWVENGTAPDQTPIQLRVAGKTHHRILCPYPQEATFDKNCEDTAAAKCWHCTGSLTHKA